MATVTGAEGPAPVGSPVVGSVGTAFGVPARSGSGADGTVVTESPAVSVVDVTRGTGDGSVDGGGTGVLPSSSRPRFQRPSVPR